MEHLKCPHYKDCPMYNSNYRICNQTSGIVGNKVARCFQIYDRLKRKSIIQKIVTT